MTTSWHATAGPRSPVVASCTGGHATVVPDMIDIRRVRDDSAAVKDGLQRRGVDPTEIDRLLGMDAAARAAIGQRDELRSRVKSLSRQVGEARKAGDLAQA